MPCFGICKAECSVGSNRKIPATDPTFIAPGSTGVRLSGRQAGVKGGSCPAFPPMLHRSLEQFAKQAVPLCQQSHSHCICLWIRLYVYNVLMLKQTVFWILLNCALLEFWEKNSFLTPDRDQLSLCSKEQRLISPVTFQPSCCKVFNKWA